MMAAVYRLTFTRELVLTNVEKVELNQLSVSPADLRSHKASDNDHIRLGQ